MEIKTRFDEDMLITDLRIYMKNNKITLKEFGKLSGVDPAIISKILNQKGCQSTKAKTKLIKTIGGTVDDYMIKGYCIEIHNDVNFDELSVEELTGWINKLKKLRDDKCRYELDRISKEQKYYEQLLKEEA